MDFSQAEPVIGVVARSGSRSCVDFSKTALKNLGGDRYLSVMVKVGCYILPATVVPRRGDQCRVYVMELAFEVAGLKEGDLVSMELIADPERDVERRARLKGR